MIYKFKILSLISVIVCLSLASFAQGKDSMAILRIGQQHSYTIDNNDTIGAVFLFHSSDTLWTFSDFEYNLLINGNNPNKPAFKNISSDLTLKVGEQSITRNIIPAPKAKAGNYTGIISFLDRNNRLYEHPIHIQLKHAFKWPLLVFILGLFLGTFFKIIAKEEQWLMLKMSLHELIIIISNTVSDEIKKSKWISTANLMIKSIEAKELTYETANDYYEKLKKEVEAATQIQVATDYKENRTINVLIYLAHFIISLLIGLFVFHQLYTQNLIFGSDGLQDYLKLLGAALGISYLSNQLISERILKVINPIKKVND